MNEIEFTIILPIYKVKIEYLKKCLDSIKKQTYRNFECIIICDGVEKKLEDFILEYVKKISYFKLIIKENTGVSDSRNIAIEQASGKYITFIDADDWLELDALYNINKSIVKENEKYDYYIGKSYINKNNKSFKYNNLKEYNHKIDDNDKINLFQSTFGVKKSGYHWIESVWANYYSREFINKNKIRFNKNIKIGEDLLFNYDIWERAKCGYYLNSYVYNYRINDNSVMNSSFTSIYSKYEKLNKFYIKKCESLSKKYNKNYRNFLLKQLKRFFFKFDFKNLDELYKIIDKNVYLENIKKISIFSLNFLDMVILLGFRYKLNIFLNWLKKIYLLKKRRSYEKS